MLRGFHDLVKSEEHAPTPIIIFTSQEVSIGVYKILEIDIWENFRELKRPLIISKMQCCSLKESKIKNYHYVHENNIDLIEYVNVLY